MAVIRKRDVRRPVLARETVQVDALGGEVVVRGMTLAERMRASQTTDYAGVAMTLATCVLDADDEPVLTQAEWEAFPDTLQACNLYAKVSQLSGLAREDVEKKSESAPT